MPAQSLNVPVVKPPSWTSTTIVSTPSRLRIGTYLFAVCASSRNARPATPDGVTSCGVPSSVIPMNPTFTPPIVLIEYGGSRFFVCGAFGFVELPLAGLGALAGLARLGLRLEALRYFAVALTYAARCAAVTVTSTFAERYWNCAPANASPSWQPSVGWQPPRCMRSSWPEPSSNSWLPTDVTCRPASPSDSIVGSSWNSAERSGEAPIMSPAPTTRVFAFVALSRDMWVAKNSAPPASTVPMRPLDPLGGSRFPWKSLNESSCTDTGAAAAPLESVRALASVTPIVSANATASRSPVWSFFTCPPLKSSD